LIATSTVHQNKKIEKPTKNHVRKKTDEQQTSYIWGSTENRNEIKAKSANKLTKKWRKTEKSKKN